MRKALGSQQKCTLVPLHFYCTSCAVHRELQSSRLATKPYLSGFNIDPADGRGWASKPFTLATTRCAHAHST